LNNWSASDCEILPHQGTATLIVKGSDMDREEGMDVLRRGAWLRDTPADFRNGILSLCRWERLEAGALIQTGSNEDGEMSGLASGTIELRSVVGRPDMPIMHFARPVFWLNFTRIIS